MNAGHAVLSNRCAICGRPCVRGWYERDLQLIRRAVGLGATLRAPEQSCYHLPCLSTLKKWLHTKTVSPVTD